MSPGVEAARLGLVRCGSCGGLARSPALTPAAPMRCPRCHARVAPRKPNSISRTWALVTASALLYVPANVYPIMSVEHFGRRRDDTIVSGVLALADADMLPLAVLIFFASITVPVLKLLGLSFLLLSLHFGHGTQARHHARARRHTRLYRLIEAIGRWSMIDLFVIAILVALVRLEGIATIVPGPAASAFGAVVVLTMVAARTFDPRLIWDGIRRD